MLIARLFRAAFGFKVFGEVVGQRSLRTLGGIAVLAAVSAAMATIVIVVALFAALRLTAPEIAALPTVTIVNGEASCDAPQPWVREVGEGDNQWKLVIDTTGTITTLPKNKNGVLVSKRQLVMRQIHHDDTRVVDFADSASPEPRSFGPAELGELAAAVKRRAPLVIGAVTFVWFLFAKTIIALLMVLVALIVAQTMKRPLSFGALLALAVHGMVPAVLLDCVLMAMPFDVPVFWLSYLVIAAVWTGLGTRAAVRATTSAPIVR